MTSWGRAAYSPPTSKLRSEREINIHFAWASVCWGLCITDTKPRRSLPTPHSSFLLFVSEGAGLLVSPLLLKVSEGNVRAAKTKCKLKKPMKGCGMSCKTSRGVLPPTLHSVAGKRHQHSRDIAPQMEISWTSHSTPPQGPVCNSILWKQHSGGYFYTGKMTVWISLPQLTRQNSFFLFKSSRALVKRFSCYSQHVHRSYKDILSQAIHMLLKS